MNKTTLKAVGKRMVVINRGGVKIMTRIPRNSPCPCGSGKKYKKCCLDKGSGQETTTGPDYG